MTSMKNYLKLMLKRLKPASRPSSYTSMVIDVSLSKDFEASHLQDAINIPIYTITSLLDVIAGFNKTIIVVSNSESLSKTAFNILSAKGLKVIIGGSWTNCKNDGACIEKED